jgi:cytochrome P450
MASQFPIAYESDITTDFLSNVLGILTQCYEQHGPSFYVRLYGKSHLFLIGPDASHFVLSNSESIFSARNAALSTGVSLFGDAFLYLDGTDHLAIRNIFQSIFRSALRRIDLIRNVATTAIQAWSRRPQVCMFREAQVLFLKTNCELILNWTPTHRQAVLLVDLLETLASGLYVVEETAISDPLFRRALSAKRRLYEFWQANLGATALTGEHLALNVGNINSGNSLLDNLNMILWAAFDTCSATFAFLVNEIVAQPDVALALKEAGATVENHLKGGEGSNLPEALILETLRLWPPVYVLSRAALSDVSFRQTTIPAGTVVNIAPILLHRLEQLYKDPEEFKPRRFLHTDLLTGHTGIFIPFGMGVKACIGKHLAMREVEEAIKTLFQVAQLTTVKRIESYLWVPGLRPQSGPIVTVEGIRTT